MSNYANSPEHDVTLPLPSADQVYQASITKVFLDVSKKSGAFYYRFYFDLNNYEVATNPKDPNGYWFHMHAFNLTESQIQAKLDEVAAMGKDAVAKGDIEAADSLRNKYSLYLKAKTIQFSEAHQETISKWKKFITWVLLEEYGLRNRAYSEQHFYTFEEVMTILKRRRRCSVVFKYTEGYDYPLAEICQPVTVPYSNIIREEVQW